MRVLSNLEMTSVSGGDRWCVEDSDGGSGSGGASGIWGNENAGQSWDLSQIDGCTGVPDAPFGFDFSADCNNHDMNTSETTSMSRAQADTQFRTDMLNTCKQNYDGSLLCQATANGYYLGVRIFGGLFYQGNP